MRSIIVVSTTRAPSRASAVFCASALLLSGAVITSPAQTPPADPHSQVPTSDAAGQNSQQLAQQIEQLRAQVAKLQAAVQQNSPGKKATTKSGMGNGGKAGGMGVMGGMAAPSNAAMPPSGGGMAMMDDEGEMGSMSRRPKPAMPSGGGGKAMSMGMMDDDEGEMAGMAAGSKGGMSSVPAASMGMCCMGEMGGMSGGTSGGMGGMSGGAAMPQSGMATMTGPSSAMPGQPGASHLYHIGSTGFFLNHPKHITLTADQKSRLNRLKESAMLDRATGQRKIDQAEQELYSLTGADQLDNSKVQAKIGEIEKLRAEQRMNFIRAVDEASKVLTHDQHQVLMGTMAPGKK